MHFFSFLLRYLTVGVRPFITEIDNPIQSEVFIPPNQLWKLVHQPITKLSMIRRGIAQGGIQFQTHITEAQESGTRQGGVRCAKWQKHSAAQLSLDDAAELVGSSLARTHLVLWFKLPSP